MNATEESISKALDDISLRLRSINRKEASSIVTEYHEEGDAISIRFHSYEENEHESLETEEA